MDIDKILANKRQGENAPKPLPVIKPNLPKIGITAKPQAAPAVIEVNNSLLEELEQEFTRLKKERAILSSQNARLICETEESLKKESPLLAEEFMKGNLPMPELAEHYSKMQSLLEGTSRLYDDIQKLKRGETIDLEPAGINANEFQETDALRGQIRKLDSVIAKTGKKIEIGTAKNPNRITYWREKYALAIAKRDDLKAQLKNLEHGNRR